MPRTVLLVDDAAFVRSMLREILERSGAYRVVAEASDGVAALSLVPELKPDLIISDLIMPGLDGVELTRALAGEPCRVILAASADQEGGVLNGLEAGAADFVIKPFAAEDLLRTLALPPPLPVADEPAPLRTLAVRLVIDPRMPLAPARRRALFGYLRHLDPAATQFSGESDGDGEAFSLEAVLATRLGEDSVRGWLGRLWGVSEVEIRNAPALPEEEPERAAVQGSVPRLTGSLRIKASLLDRLLDHLDQAATDREEIARHCLGVSGAAAVPVVETALRRLERSQARARSEILAARLVPFERIASRLGRAVQDPARRAGRSASLNLLGGDTRLDLGVLEEVAGLLEWWLPLVVSAEVGRADILRQLGRSEAEELRLKVSRDGARLVLLLHLPDALEDSAPADLEPVFVERLARLGGTASLVEGATGRKVEILLPAGVSLVRSYLCQAGRHLFAVPVASVERAVDLPLSGIRVSEGGTFWQEDGGDRVPLVRFPAAPWILADGQPRDGFPGLVYRVGPQRYALAVDALLGETDVVMRPLKEVKKGGQVAGMALMADGGIAMVPDLPNLARVR